MAIDEQILNRQSSVSNEKDSSIEAGNFRQFRRGNQSVVSNGNLREIRRRRINESRRKMMKDKVISKLNNNPARKTTDNLLKQAWINFIPFLGLTILWIDLHFMLNKVFGKTMFAELGEEWAPEEFKKAGGDKAEKSVALMKKVELAGCGCVNLGCLLTLVAVIALLSVMISAISDPFSFLVSIVKTEFKFIIDVIKSS